MKKISLLFLALCTQITFAQATRFVYQISMKLDSTNRNEVKTETAYLDINPEKSIFYGEKRLQRDSVFSRARQTGSFNFDRNQMENLRSNIDFIVEKNSKTGIKTFNTKIARDQYSYEEDRPMTWKILPETVNIGEYKTQKAETNFAGRKWFAWFTTEIPFQDGPYKFSGLPGLIIKVEDSKDDYSFDLKETKKIPAIQTFSQQGNMVKTKRKDFEKQNGLFKKDPVSFMQAEMNSSGINAPMRKSEPSQRKEREDRLKEEIRKNNNSIEIN